MFDKKVISINQPAYLPWLGYFDRIADSDLHVVLDHVQFEKNSMVNRNKILTSNGPTLLTVPVNTKGKFGELSISTLAINNQQKWQKKHWQSLYFNYKKSPHFSQYEQELCDIYQQPWPTLNTLLKAQLHFFLKALNIDTPLVFSSEYDWQSTKSDLVLDICKKFNADHYLSGPFGRDYLDKASFEDASIALSFQDYCHPQYEQLATPFTSHLSIVDLLFNHGDNSLNILRGNA